MGASAAGWGCSSCRCMSSTPHSIAKIPRQVIKVSTASAIEARRPDDPELMLTAAFLVPAMSLPDALLAPGELM